MSQSGGQPPGEGRKLTDPQPLAPHGFRQGAVGQGLAQVFLGEPVSKGG